MNNTSNRSDTEKVRQILHNYPAGLTIEELIERCPNITRANIDQALHRLVLTGEINRVTRAFYRVDDSE